MKILVICGVYTDQYENDILQNTKGYADQSANIFQKKLINGIQQNGYHYKVISAPLIGAYPFRYRKMFFRGFPKSDANDQYVRFNNIWGIRNISRAKSLKKAIGTYLKDEQEDTFLILVYCAHTPFLEAAEYAKKLKPKSKICFVVPDLPQYMNLNEGHRFFYDIFKKYDIEKMQKYIAGVDAFVLLTEAMKDALHVESRPYIVVEGIVNEIPEIHSEEPASDGIKRIVYAGKMNIKFGIKELVDAFTKIEDENYRLILCGDGDARSYVEEKSKTDHRIDYKGQVTAAKAKEYIQSANVLVNPRPNNEEYTKYSFPSKTIEYLLSGKPVVAYMLDGMPDIYRNFIYNIEDYSSFSQAIIEAEQHYRFMQENNFFQYAQEHLMSRNVVHAIQRIFEKC